MKRFFRAPKKLNIHVNLIKYWLPATTAQHFITTASFCNVFDMVNQSCTEGVQSSSLAKFGTAN